MEGRMNISKMESVVVVPVRDRNATAVDATHKTIDPNQLNQYQFVSDSERFVFVVYPRVSRLSKSEPISE